MYGHPDNYGSPASDAFGDDLAEIDAVLEEDDEEFGALLGIGKGGGVLGIAVGEKAQRNKISRILGKLKKFLEQDKMEKARRYAKALSKVNLIEKKGYTTPEIQAWVDYASGGSEEDLREALEAVDWTGDEDLDQDEEGEVYDARGAVVTRHRGRGRRLPPGFRPRGYSRWADARKARWLSRHPNAASIRLPIDPGYHGGRRPHGAVRPAAARRSAPAARQARPTRPVRRQARLAAARAAGRTLGRRMASSRYGLEEAIEEGVDEFAGLIGASAFEPLAGSDALERDVLLEDDIDDDLEGIDTDDEDESFGAYIAAYGEDEDDDEFGAYIAAYGEDEDDEFGAYVPQFGAVFRRDIQSRLEAARRRYERLRGKETDQQKVQEAWQDYQRLVKAYQAASELPTAQRAGPSLARSWGHQRDDAGSPEDYSDPEDKIFRLGGRVAASEEEDEDDDLDLEEAV